MRAGVESASAAGQSGNVKARAAFFQSMAQQKDKDNISTGAGLSMGGAQRVPMGATSIGLAADKAAGVLKRPLPLGACSTTSVSSTACVLAASSTAPQALTTAASGEAASAAAPGASNATAAGAGTGTLAPGAGLAAAAADRHKRAEVKRREEDERRRAELEARAKVGTFLPGGHNIIALQLAQSFPIARPC